MCVVIVSWSGSVVTVAVTLLHNGSCRDGNFSYFRSTVLTASSIITIFFHFFPCIVH